MTAEWLPEAAEETRQLSFGALLIVLVLTLFAGSARRQTAGQIRLAAPAFVPLAPEAARGFADELGAAYRSVLDAERRGGYEQP